ncbi:MAG: carboxypeptidase regulatory-like domain-containing protein [Flavobacteriaceae bacterium]|nr:carboxypeptidase regulatory-like domain-containing protein [Flavobacteriaceae bacterium]
MLDENLEGGSSYTFILDWDVQRSVVKAGNSGKYILKPVIRANAEVNSGTLGGQVVADPLNDDDNITQPLANTLVSVFTLEGVLVTQTLTNELGNFMVHGLRAGDYKIKIVTDPYAPYESAIVNIKAGEVTDLGIIELKVTVS